MSAAAPLRLLVATTNSGKRREIRGILGGLDLSLLTLADFAPTAEPEETGSTFVANARIKALAYAAATGELTVAEDSGLEIDALDGEPGVRSARFNGESYEEKFTTIRRMLAERGVTSSTARLSARWRWPEETRSSGRQRVPSKAGSSCRRGARPASATTPSSTTRRMAARWPRWTARGRRR